MNVRDLAPRAVMARIVRRAIASGRFDQVVRERMEASGFVATATEKVRTEEDAALQRIARAAVAVRFHGRGVRSTCMDDPEIARFCVDRFGYATLDQAAVEAKERFGTQAPTRSAIWRFWRHLRQAALDQVNGETAKSSRPGASI